MSSEQSLNSLQIICIYFHHHHHVVLVAWISLTLSRHFSLSFLASGRSSGEHTVSSHRSWMYVRPGRPAFARPCVGVHKSTSLISSSLLLQQCPAYLVRITCIVFVIGGRWPYSWCLVGCCCQDLFKIARSIQCHIGQSHSISQNILPIFVLKSRMIHFETLAYIRDSWKLMIVS